MSYFITPATSAMWRGTAPECSIDLFKKEELESVIKLCVIEFDLFGSWNLVDKVELQITRKDMTKQSDSQFKVSTNVQVGIFCFIVFTCPVRNTISPFGIFLLNVVFSRTMP